MTLRKALLHPFNLLLLTGTVFTAAGLWLLVPWSERAWWVLGWGLALYGVSTALTRAGWRLSQDSKPVADIPQEPVVSLPREREAPEPGLGEPAARPREDLAALTEEALRRLKRPAALAECGLAGALPRTLSSSKVPDGAAGPLATAHALRQVLLGTIDSMKPEAGDESSPAALQYRILHEEYVLGRPTRAIMSRLNISESTFHRYRRDAIAALAQELAAREAGLSSDPAP